MKILAVLSAGARGVESFEASNCGPFRRQVARREAVQVGVTIQRQGTGFNSLY